MTSWQPDPLRQRLGRYTIQDVWELPDEAPRVELRDGAISVVPLPTPAHQNTAALIAMWLRHHAPPGLDATFGMDLMIDSVNTYVPDATVHRADVARDRRYRRPDEVLIAIEVVSPATRRRDRFERPGGFAAAGIPHYWRVEQDPVHVYAYRLGADDHYALAADSARLLELDEPFEIRLPIALITP